MTHIWNEIQEWINYKALWNLSREERIKLLRKNSPHSLSRVCFQCMNIGLEIWSNHESIIDDMAAAVLIFAEKAQIWDQKALDTLGRFSTHISTREEMLQNNGKENPNSKKVRQRFFTTLWNEQKVYFDTTMQDIYTKAIWIVWWVPQYVHYIKENTSHSLLSTLDNSDVKFEDEY